MRLHKRLLSFGLSAALVLSYVTVIPAYALSESEQTPPKTLMSTETLAVTSGSSGAGITFRDSFTENWEGGLDRNKWQVEKYNNEYDDDFAVVDDPTGKLNSDGKVNQVITYNRLNTWLVANEAYWPTEGYTAGDITKISFRLLWKDLNFAVNGASKGGEPGLVFTFADKDNMCGAYAISKYKSVDGFFLNTSSYASGTIYEHGFDPGFHYPGLYATGFAYNDWFDVTVLYSSTTITMIVKDKNNVALTRSNVPCNFTGGRYAIGNRLFNAASNALMSSGTAYIDDIKVDFKQSQKDADIEQKNVNVFYAGNTYFEPGDTLNVTGEKLGTTVKSAKIKKIDNAKSADTALAKYINETDYETAVVPNVDWSEIPAVSGSEIDLTIQQRTNVGLKMILPDGSVTGQEMYAERGIYAVLLEATAEDGNDAVVIVNNPQISLRLHDDGDYATPGGWLKLGGYNLSVQDDASKVSAIIIDKDGNRTLIDNSKIEVDTKANNNGKDNDYYMMVHLPNLAVGKYKIMLHNGYGGDYGWCMPYDFTVKAKSASAEWRAKGTFNVRNYGAIGDSWTNDTAAIMRAINAAEANGGGMLYFPALDNKVGACYRITAPIIVGENISFVGDGITSSVILYDNFNNPKNPEYIISHEKNFEFTNMALYSGNTATHELFHRSVEKGTETGKFYLHDMSVTFDVTAAMSLGVGVLMEGYSDVTANLAKTAEMIGVGQLVTDSYSTTEVFNSIVNADILIARRMARGSHHLFISAQYTHLANYVPFQGQNYVGANSSIAGFQENCKLEILSANTLHRNPKSTDVTTNNREALICDVRRDVAGVHIQPFIQDSYPDDELTMLLASEMDTLPTQAAKDKLFQDVKKYITDHKGMAYRFLDNKKVGPDIAITQGQGMGQVRRISNALQIGEYVYFTVATPFAVTPNRSSSVLVGCPMRKVFAVNGTFINGSRVGPFGTAVDMVLDGTTMRESESGVSISAAYGGLMWYCTAKNTNSDDIAWGYVNQVKFGDAAGLQLHDNNENAYTQFGIRYCNNYTGESGLYSFEVTNTLFPITVSDIVVENNDFVSSNSAISIKCSGNSQGMWFRNNKQLTETGNSDSTISAYQYAALSTIKTYGAANQYVIGTPRLYCDEYATAVATRQLGDVNGDGRISLKDVTLIRYLLAERVTADQLNKDFGSGTATKYADITKDSILDARDIYAIRANILGEEWTGGQSSEDDSGNDSLPDKVITEAFNNTDFSNNLWSNYANFTVAGERVTGVTDRMKVMAANGSKKVDRPMTKVSFDVSIAGTGGGLLLAPEKWAYLYPIYHTDGTTTVREAVTLMASPTEFKLIDNRPDVALAGRAIGTNIASLFPHANGAYPATLISGVSSVTAPVHMTITYDWTNYNEAGGWKVAWTLTAEFTPASGTDPVVLTTSAIDTITAATKPAAKDFTFAVCNPTTLDNVVLTYPGVPSDTQITETFNDTGYSNNLWSNYANFTVAGEKVTGVTDRMKVMAANGSNKIDRTMKQVSFDVSLAGTGGGLLLAPENWAYMYPIYHTDGTTTVREAVTLMASPTEFKLIDNRPDAALAGRAIGTNIASLFPHANGAYPATLISGVSSVTAPVHMTITYDWTNYNEAGGWKVAWTLTAEFTPASGTDPVVVTTSAIDTITAATKPAAKDFTFAVCNPTTLDNVFATYQSN